MSDQLSDHPFRRGLHTARQVAPAGAVLVTVAIAILVSYYTLAPVRAALDALAALKLRTGIFFAVISTPIFGAVVPILVQQSMKATRTDAAWRKMPYLVLFWICKGIEVDLLYRLLALIFGDSNAVGVVLCKVVLDQFVYGPVWALPTTVIGYLFPDVGYSPRRLVRELGPHWYRSRIAPVLIANWFVWLPSVAVIYSLPLALQLPIQNIVLCLWSILLLVIVRKPVTRLRNGETQ